MSDYSLKDALSAANPSNIADALRKVDLGRMLLPIRQVYTPTEAGISITLDPPAASPAMFVAYALLEGGFSGTYVATPGVVVGASSSFVGACQLSADGTTVTFPDAVVQATICYMAASKTDLNAPFSFAAP